MTEPQAPKTTMAVEAPGVVPVPEGVPGNVQSTIEGGNQGNVWVTVTPTQVRRPWRATARTAFQFVLAACLLLPFVVQATGLDPQVYPWLGGLLAVTAATARVMALPQVETFLRRFAPFLAASKR